MKQQNRFGTITALALALCLAVAPAWAGPFEVINDYGDTVEAMCDGNTSFTSLANGSTTDFDCSSGLLTRVMGEVTSQSHSFDCSSGEQQESTVTQTDEGGVNWAHKCETQ